VIEQSETTIAPSQGSYGGAARPPASHFIPEIDGLRAIAVLGVLAFHLRLPLSRIGWTGVELFFVISGFLITRILVRTRDRPHYFKNFYTRRALRIFPIYYLVLFIYCIAALLVTNSSGVRTLPYYFGYLQTFPQLKSNFTDAPLLAHTWTLAIEEQFYFLWPMVVYLCRGRKLLVASLFMIAVPLVVRFLTLALPSPFLIDEWLPVQVDALAAGVLVAIAFQYWDRESIKKWMSGALLVGFIGLATVVMAAGTSAFRTPALWAKLWYAPFLVSALALFFGGAVGLVALGLKSFRLLRLGFLRHVGKISYGIYLYHPFVFAAVFAFAKTYRLEGGLIYRFGTIAACLGLTYVVALASWRLIESPILRFKDRFSQQGEAVPLGALHRGI
jgi:peptidoglycan/LPS O-acetylase OafA/YrhL